MCARTRVFVCVGGGGGRAELGVGKFSFTRSVLLVGIVI